MGDRTDPVAEWSDYWRQTAADGCTAALPPAVAACIAAGWTRLFQPLSARTTVIDIACGRGAVLALARAAGCVVTGVDAAQISGADPAILGGIDAARLPFADASFDVAVSQFGVEYAGLEAAGLEAARVARRHLWLFLHAADGPVVAAAHEQVAQAAWLVPAFVRLLAHVSTPDVADIERLRAEILVQAQAASNTALLESVWQMAGAQVAKPDAAVIRALAAEVEAWARRLHLLTAAAAGAAAVSALAQLLQSAGWTVVIRDEGAPPVGRWLLANR